MKSTSISGFILAFLLLSSAFASDNQTLITQNQKRNSFQNRTESDYELLAGIGIAYSMLDGLSFTAGKYLNEDTVLELEIFAGNDDEETNSPKSIFGLSVNAKKFVGNSFYIRPGLFYGNYKEENTRPEILEDERSSFRRSDLGVSFMIGNQWQWEAFSMGVDWFGVQYGALNLSKSGKADWGDFLIDQKHWVSFTLLRLNLGASF